MKSLSYPIPALWEAHNVGTYRADPEQVHVFLQYKKLRFREEKTLLYSRSLHSMVRILLGD